MIFSAIRISINLAMIFLTTSLYCILLIGCGKKNNNLTSKVESAVLCVKNADSLELLEKCYTDDTLKAAKSLLAKKLITENQIYSILKFTDKDDTWITIEEKINNDKALISIKFLKHSNENMKTFQLGLKAENTNGQWKLDMSDSFKIDDNENRSIKKYLLDAFKNY